MSTHRNSAQHAGYRHGARGPNGRPQCRRCLAEVGKGRSTFCSDTCVEAFKIATGNSGWVRPAVMARDQGVCAACRRDTARDRRLALLAARMIHRRSEKDDPHRHYMYDPYRADDTYWAIMGRWGYRPRQSLWEADHIIPVVEGGGGCGLEGYRTLCRACHVRVTRELAGRRAQARKALDAPR